MKERLLAPWDWLRIVRLVIGVSVILQAVLLRSGLLTVAGVLLTSMALLNMGCGVNGCNTVRTSAKGPGQRVEETQFEEIT